MSATTEPNASTRAIRTYEPTAGLGTLISRALPCAIPCRIVWLLVVFYFGGLDVGPGVSPRKY